MDPESVQEIDNEDYSLWDSAITAFADKGGFSSMLKNSGGTATFDLNTMLPTFADFAKMDIRTEWAVDKIIPFQNNTLLTAGGGKLKTTVCLQIGSCVAEGKPFVGLTTKRMPVYYVDFENSLSTLCDRAKVLGPSSMKVWHLSNSFPPPRLDSKEDWKLFKGLLPGLLIIDTLRSSQLLDENSSKDMALIMNRLKELREFGHTIILIHHSPKADERMYKGSSAISDLVDHTLVLERVRSVGSEEVVEDDEQDLPLRLGVRGKTRFEPFSIFLKFDPSCGFIPAENPDYNTLDQLRQILSDSSGDGLNQTQFFKAVKELEIKRSKFRRLLKKGEGEYWEKSPISYKNSVVYRAIFPVIKPVVQGRLDNYEKQTAKVIEKTELFSYPEGEKTSEITGVSGSGSVVSPFIRENNRQLTEPLEQDNCQEIMSEEDDEGE